LLAAHVGYKRPSRDPVDLPDGSFEKAKADTDHLFKDLDPAKLFGKPVK
jgi:hypothetical protein